MGCRLLNGRRVMYRTWRIIEHAPAPGAWNMAVDEALLSSVDRGPTFRIYGWDEWTLSLGRFQDPVEDLLPAFLASPSYPVVRRMTGGGAILHGGELTYSLVLHQDDLGTANVKESFRLLCGVLLRFYRKLGLHAAFARDVMDPGGGTVQIPVQALGAKTAFCYSGRELYDVVIPRTGASGEASKIGGNAQRRFRKTIFQHGSIPIVLNQEGLRKIFPPEALPPSGDITALSEVGRIDGDVPGESDRPSLVGLLRESFLELLREDLTGSEALTGDLTPEERASAEELEREVYRSGSWTFHRKRPAAS